MDQIVAYLRMVLDEQIIIEPYNVKDKLSLYFAGIYQFYKVKVLGAEFLLVKPSEESTVAQIKKQIIALEDKLDYKVVLLVQDLTPYRRKKMIKEMVPFISVDQQMFLPFIGVHLQSKREKMNKEYVIERFTPAMQLIFLAILYDEKSYVSQDELSERLSVSTMTVSRALDVFVNLRLLEFSVEGKTGRKKIYHCRDKKLYFESGKSYLINPVSKRFFVCQVPKGIKTYKSDLTALGEITMLGEPDHLIVAISAEDERSMKPYGVSGEMGREEHLTEIHVMKYNVGLLTKNEYVDAISLIYGLGERDDRIEIAIDEMMEEYAWYEG